LDDATNYQQRAKKILFFVVHLLNQRYYLSLIPSQMTILIEDSDK